MDDRATLRGGRRAWVIALVAILCSLAPVSRAAAQAPFTPPHVGHVWLLNIENLSYDATFGLDQPGTPAPFMARDLPQQGARLTQFHAIGHNSLDNYIAEISGQAPDPETQDDCDVPGRGYGDFDDGGAGAFGQRIGHGCIYPAPVKTLADQLGEHGLTWKGYMEDLGADSAEDGGTTCGHTKPGGPPQKNSSFDEYASKHNPFVWFRSIVGPGDGYSELCRTRSVPLSDLAGDLDRIATTPNFSLITPNMVNDAHDSNNTEGAIRWTDNWMRQIVTLITASPAYRQDGMIIVTADEGRLDDTASCCNEIPGPNSASPGLAGPGGGRIGAVIVSPFVKPGTVSDQPYNHYSMLRSLEDAFGITTGGDDGHGHLGFAGSYPGYDGPGAFGADLYTAGVADRPVTRARPAGGAPVGADGSTTWEQPGPQGDDLRGVACAAAGRCVAVGDVGAIVTTSDSSTWTRVPSGTGAGLLGVSCPGGSRCVAVGDDGTILSSDDGGATWHARPSATTRTLRAVACATSEDCVAVGDGGTVVRSTDGGATWSPGTSAGDQRLNAVSCPTPTDCFGAGEPETIVASHDGGATWARQQTPPTQVPRDGGAQAPGRYLALVCTSATACLALGDAHVAAATADGGATWQAVDLGVDSTPYSEAASCANESACLVVGRAAYSYPIYGDEAPGSYAPITVAGIRHGSYDARVSSRFDELHGVSCALDLTCVGVGAHGAILRFTALPSGTTTGQLPAIADVRGGAARDLGGLSCPGRDTCYAVGDGLPVCAYPCDGNHQVIRTPSPVLTRSVDGWSSNHVDTDQRLDAVSCSALTSCVAVGDAGTIAVTNDGTHWTPIADGDGSRRMANLLGVSCAWHSAACVAVGDHGVVYRSGDGGVTWVKGVSGTEVPLSAVSCPTAQRCVAVGSFGTAIRSTDGGATWSGADTGTAMPLLGVSCATADVCVAVGSDATLVRSTDGGATWAASPSPVDGVDYTAVSCASAETCAATGPDGIVIATGSHGQSWQRQGTGTDRLLRGVSCPAADRCYEAGDSGAILRTAPAVQPATATDERHGADSSTAPSGAPGGDGPGSGSRTCAAGAGPASRIVSLALTRRRVAVTGRAALPACAGKVTRVGVAVARLSGKRCRFLGRHGRLGHPRRCANALFRAARVRGRSWSLHQRVRLPAGSYRVIARAVDDHGRSEPRAVRPSLGARLR